MRKWIKNSLLAVMALLVMMTACPPEAVKAAEDEYAITLSAPLVDGAFEYLEGFCEKNPTLGTRILYGSESDRAILKKMSDIIVKGKTTDKEKALAIEKWVANNIEYRSYMKGTNYFPIDTFMERMGNCVGYALLMENFLRNQGIPAYAVSGIRGDMTGFIKVSQLQLRGDEAIGGHAWIMVYYDEQWHLFDPLFKEYDCTDREYIKKWYLFYDIEGINPYSDKVDYTKIGWWSYIFWQDGKFMSIAKDGKTIYDIGSPGTKWNGTVSFLGHNREQHEDGIHDGYSYVENPERKDAMVTGEMYTDGWIRYGTDVYGYAQENGIITSNRVYEIDGKSYFQPFGGERLIMPDDWGEITLTQGYPTIKLGETKRMPLTRWYVDYLKNTAELPASNAVISLEDVDIRVELNPQSKDASMFGDATVDDRLNVTATREGLVILQIEAWYKSEPDQTEYDVYNYGSFVQLYVTKEDRVPDYTNEDEAYQMIQDFSARMYTVALGRDYDKPGLDDWSNQLKEHKIDGAGIARGFIMSQEFQKKELSDDEYVETLYETFFGRASDEGGKQNWLNAMAAGKSREYVLAGFVNSKEFDNLSNEAGIARGYMYEDGSVVDPGLRLYVERMYTKALNRKGEKDGVDNWVNSLIAKNVTPMEVARAFISGKYSSAQEFLNRNLSDEDYVETLYATFFDRGSDPLGKADWLDKMRNQGYDRDQVLEGFMGAQEYLNLLKKFNL